MAPAAARPERGRMILVGTSGYSYPEWRGVFYPDRLPAARMLTHYAERFRAVELNSTYYRIPTPRMLEGIVRRAGPGLTFAVKAPRELTHDRDKAAGALPLFREALKPMEDAGALGCVLLQFPFSFKPGPASAAHLLSLRGGLEDLPTVVEFRHRRWFTEDTFDWLRRHRLGFCCVDEPRLPGLMPPEAVSTGPVAYVRFHGRNAAHWWQHAEAWERYDYLYTEDELRPWVDKIRTLESQSTTTFVFFNNHAGGQAATNARMMRRLLGEPGAPGG